MTQAISGSGATSAYTELASLLVEMDSNQVESQQLQREQARDTYLAEAQQQVEALQSAANTTLAGGLVSAGFAVAGGVMQVDSACVQFDADMKEVAVKGLDCKSDTFKADVLFLNAAKADDTKTARILGGLGESFSKSVQPATMIADGIAQGSRAEAKRDEILAEQAKWQAGDASTSIDKGDKQIDKFLDLIQGMQRDANSSTNSIIGRI